MGLVNLPVLDRARGASQELKISELVDAVRGNGLEQVRAILQAQPELADKPLAYSDERRPIHFAVMNRSAEMVALLMRHGAGARAGVYPHRDATTAWTMATERGYPEIVAVIEDAEQKLGGEAEAPSLLKDSALDDLQLLWNCAAQGQIEEAEALLARGIDPNAHVDSSGSAVYSAYSHKQWKMVEFLCARRGRVTADIAGIYRQTELARQMLANGEPVAEELLRHGASGGDPEIVRMALERIDWPPADRRWFGCLTEPLYFWHFIPWLYAGNRELDRRTYLPCFRMILSRCGPNLVGVSGGRRCMKSRRCGRM